MQLFQWSFKCTCSKYMLMLNSLLVAWWCWYFYTFTIIQIDFISPNGHEKGFSWFVYNLYSLVFFHKNRIDILSLVINWNKWVLLSSEKEKIKLNIAMCTFSIINKFLLARKQTKQTENFSTLSPHNIFLTMILTSEKNINTH